MERANHSSDNPYTQLEGYRVDDASGEEVGEIEDTVYDAPSDVLKYVVVRGHPIPAERIEVDAGDQRVSVPYEGQT
jgi:sporulation protein YlmC with PRC-barrel domain